MVIFHSYVSLPEGTGLITWQLTGRTECRTEVIHMGDYGRIHLLDHCAGSTCYWCFFFIFFTCGCVADIPRMPGYAPPATTGKDHSSLWYYKIKLSSSYFQQKKQHTLQPLDFYGFLVHPQEFKWTFP